MCLGQRPSLTAHATTFVTLDHEANRTHTGSDHDEIAISHLFFSASSRLFDILFEILVRIYVPEDRNPSAKLTISASFASTVVDLEEKFDSWTAQLPETLRTSSDGLSVVAVQQSQFLRQR